MNDELIQRKDGSILHFLHAADMEGHGWVAIDHWEADRYAVGISRKEGSGGLAYVSTWRKPSGRYHVELEAPVEYDPVGYTTETVIDDCDVDQAIAVIEEHLGSPRHE